MVWDSLMWAWLVLTCYLVGSVPTAYLLTRLLRGKDIRRLGDGNSGAANVFRVVGSRAGLAVGVLDIGKGAAGVLLAQAISHSTEVEMIAGVAVVAGHNWPAHLNWRGGRGAAPAVGVLLATLPTVALPLGVAAVAFLIVAKSTIKALSLWFMAIPVLAWLVGYSYSQVAYSVGIPVMVGISHYVSVRRRSLTARDVGIPIQVKKDVGLR